MSEAPALSSESPATKPAHDDAFNCPNCGRENSGDFCAGCGQKLIHPGDLSLKHAWHHLVHEFFHVDGKIFNSLKLLFTRPGQLTLDFLAGRRARHVHPIRLFLVIGFVFFLFARVSSPIDMHVAFNNQAGPAVKKFETLLARRGITSDQFASEANTRIAGAFKAIDIAAILFQGFWLWVMFRKKRPYLAENMVTALHISCFNMIVWVVLGSLTWMHVSPGIWRTGAMIFGLVYFLLATRRIYGGGWWSLALKWALLQVFSIFVISVAMGAILFRMLTGH